MLDRIVSNHETSKTNMRHDVQAICTAHHRPQQPEHVLYSIRFYSILSVSFYYDRTSNWPRECAGIYINGLNNAIMSHYRTVITRQPSKLWVHPRAFVTPHCPLQLDNETSKRRPQPRRSCATTPIPLELLHPSRTRVTDAPVYAIRNAPHTTFITSQVPVDKCC